MQYLLARPQGGCKSGENRFKIVNQCVWARPADTNAVSKIQPRARRVLHPVSSILTWILKFKPELILLCNCPTVLILEWLQQSIWSNCIFVTVLIHLYIRPSSSLITHVLHTHTAKQRMPSLYFHSAFVRWYRQARSKFAGGFTVLVKRHWKPFHPGNQLSSQS